MGLTQAGFKLKHRVEQVGGFGLAQEEANRHLLGWDWTAQAGTPDTWEPFDVPAVFGCPPCSGFSLMSDKKWRGVDSPINACMHNLVEYAAKCDPQLVIFESVQQAYSTGYKLMMELRDKLEHLTGQLWNLHHVLHNAASVGGAAIRRRYFWVAARIPFGLEMPVVYRVPRLNDVIGDLEPLALTWERQPYRNPASWWVEQQGLLSKTGGVDGHRDKPTPYVQRALDLIPGAGPWGPRENIETMLKRHWERNGYLPPSWESRLPKLLEKDFDQGFNQLLRWNGEKMARVVTGGGGAAMLHPNLDRGLTHREIARIMGFPDDWKIKPLMGLSGLQAGWGKGVSTAPAKWIGMWARRALEGNPGPDPGEQTGEREFVHNSTAAYKSVTKEN